MAETHLQVNHDGSKEMRKTVLWPSSKGEQKEIIRNLFEQNNWVVSSLENQSGSFWKVVTSTLEKQLKINHFDRNR